MARYSTLFFREGLTTDPCWVWSTNNDNENLLVARWSRMIRWLWQQTIATRASNLVQQWTPPHILICCCRLSVWHLSTCDRITFDSKHCNHAARIPFTQPITHLHAVMHLTASVFYQGRTKSKSPLNEKHQAIKKVNTDMHHGMSGHNQVRRCFLFHMSIRPHVLPPCHSPVSKLERVSPIETYKNSNEHEFWLGNGQMRACAWIVALCFFCFSHVVEIQWEQACDSCSYPTHIDVNWDTRTTIMIGHFWSTYPCTFAIDVYFWVSTR